LIYQTRYQENVAGLRLRQVQDYRSSKTKTENALIVMLIIIHRRGLYIQYGVVQKVQIKSSR